MIMLCCKLFFFFYKQKTAYEMRISDWSSDVCSSDLPRRCAYSHHRRTGPHRHRYPRGRPDPARSGRNHPSGTGIAHGVRFGKWPRGRRRRSEEHTSELQSLMRISYAVFCLKKKKQAMSVINDTQKASNTTKSYTQI